MLGAVRAFLALFNEIEPAEQPLARLARALDLLLVDVDVEESECPGPSDLSDPSDLDADLPDPPELDYAHIRHLVVATFPNLAFYHVMVPEGADKTAEPMLGDAVDDVADIYRDLQAVIWRLENTSEDDAMWHFRFSFRTHWGRHAIDLRSYLHHCMFET